MNKKSAITAGIIIIVLIFNGLYILFNYRFIPSSVRSSIVLYDPNNENPERQKELTNAGYFQNGVEQGSLEAQCSSWLCSLDLYEVRFRGTIIKPIHRIRINGKRLTTESKKYYNSGYIKGYTEVCPKHRLDCDTKISQIRSDYKKYYGDDLLDVAEVGHYTISAKSVETRIEHGLSSYNIDGGKFVTINTDELLDNNNLPIREKSVGQAIVSPNKKFILLDIIGSEEKQQLYVYEIDSTSIHYVVNYRGFVEWLSDSRLWIRNYKGSGGISDLESEYFSTDKNTPWIIKKK